MTDRFEGLLVATLREHGDDAPNGTVLSDLAPAARREAVVLRRRRVGLVTAAVLLVGIAVALPGRVTSEAEAPPGGGTPSPRVTVDPDRRTTLSLDGLPSGTAPTVGVASGDTLRHSRGYDVPLPFGTTDVTEWGASVVAVREASHPQLRVVDRSGTQQLAADARWPVVGADGRLAYIALDQQVLVVMSATDTVDWTVDVNLAHPTQPIGLLEDDRVLLAQHPARPGGRRGYVLAGPDGTHPWPAPSAVVGRDGYPVLDQLGPARRLLVARNQEGTAAGTRIALLDLTNGRVARELVAAPGVRLGQAVAETDEAVLVAVWQGGMAGLVRCDVDGACESAAASTPVALADWDETPMAPSG